MTYATIGRRAQRVSQLAFLRLLQRGLAYQLEAPTLWDVDFRTAVAQAELEDRERAGRVPSRSASPRPGRAARVEIETTRPELIPACVALVAHPDDERYQPLFGQRRAHAAVRRAGAGQAAPAGRPREGQRHRDDLHLRRHHGRDLVAGAGAARARDHPGRTARSGRSPWGAPGWESSDAARAQQRYDALRGLSAAKARARIVELLRESGDLVGEPRPITHPVKFYEKGDRPLEILTSRQWFIKTMEFREALLERGRELRVASARTCARATRTGSTA